MSARGRDRRDVETMEGVENTTFTICKIAKEK
jgi:hypothetical protein